MRAAFAACLAGLLTACAGGPPEPVRVWFDEPEDGAVLNSSNVRVVLRASGVAIRPADDQRPGGAHHHLFVNTELTPLNDTIPAGVTGIIHLGRGQTEFELQDLPAGQNRIIAVLADWEHRPLDPPAVDTLRITIQP